MERTVICQHLLIVAVVLAVGTAALAEAVTPHVTTNGSVDCSSMRSIVADVCTEGMTDQQKAIALFDFARRLMHHYPGRADRVAKHDTLHLLNTHGYSFCSQQAMLTVDLWQHAGLKARIRTVPGHSTMEAEYGGGKHWFDLLIGAYVFKRDRRTIASLAEIAADEDLLRKAAAEKRAAPGMTPCGAVLKDDAARFCRHNPKYIRECAQYADDVDYMAGTASKAGPWKWGNPDRSRYKPRINLRRGEKVTFLWAFLPDQAKCNVLDPHAAPRNYWVKPRDLPPHHFCGVEAERRDVNWKYFRPYVRQVQDVRTGRYAANGYHVYEPDLTARVASGDVEANTYAFTRGGSPALHVAEAGRPSELTFHMTTPHVYTGATITARFRRARADDVSRIYLTKKIWDRKSSRMAARKVKLWDAAGAEAGEAAAKVELKAKIRGLRDAVLTFESSTTGDPAKAGLAALKAEAIFQHNMFARPYLVNGKNRVTVKTGNARALASVPLKVTYAWKEGKETRTHVQKITESPAVYTIDVAGKEGDLPRMVSL
ncbi:MAG: hypothetical protein ACYS5V_13970, partial [Planctomycetota bacterium]